MKILMVLTSHDQLGNTGRRTGFWLEEFAAPYFVFRDAGVHLTLASPKGGQPPVDPKSDLPENQTAAMARFKQDPTAQSALASTVKLVDMKAENIDTSIRRGFKTREFTLLRGDRPQRSVEYRWPWYREPFGSGSGAVRSGDFMREMSVMVREYS